MSLPILLLGAADLLALAFVAATLAAAPRPACLGAAPPRPANDNAMQGRRRGLAAAIALMPLELSGAQARQLHLPPIQVEGGISCVDVQAQDARSLSFDCLNRQLKDAAQDHTAAAPAVTAKDVTGTGAPTTVGTFSYTATAIRMGDAFGHSAIPQRPPAPSFTNALIPHGAR